MRDYLKGKSDQGIQYEKIKRYISIWGTISKIAIVISVIYIAIAIKVIHTSYLYLLIGLPILLCLIVFLGCFLHFLVKKEQTIKSKNNKTNKLTTTNPLFQDLIEEFYHNQLESLTDLLPKEWKVVDIDDYNNSIIISIKVQRGIQIEVDISETQITITGESAKSEEEISISKNFTSENFTDLSSVLIHIVNACETISKS